MIIYLITNTVNGKRHVGQTRHTLQQRWWAHISQAKIRKDKTRLQQAIHDFGKDAFTIECLGRCEDRQNLDTCERLLIRYYKSNTPEHAIADAHKIQLSKLFAMAEKKYERGRR